ncbi:MAG TPA: response regulator transcription factor [Pyrinomonadaceae bacterium]|jgi:DNA-binding NarL/FixJ family response regulator|nr:response regulator transcription factor [Pyrinomonadaceae bacterium]
MNDEIKIVIADDHPIFRSGLRQLLETVANFKIIGEADNGEAALRLTHDIKPDVAILDIDMPEKDGFEVARSLFTDSIPVEVIFLTMHKNKSLFNAALNLGVKGYVLKDSAMADLINAVKAVCAGQNFISPQLSTFLIERRRQTEIFAENTPSINSLTPTERRILILISEYLTSKEIAAKLFISIRTVEHHRASIATKLNLKGSHALLKFALDHKNEIN